MATFNVNISMDEESNRKLHESGYSLFGFKAVEVPQPNAVPLIWFKTDNYNVDTQVNWKEEFHGYISSQVNPAVGTVITAGCTNSDIDLGGTMVITGNGNCRETTTTGTPGAISIQNNTTTEYTCGISQIVEGKPQALCAIPLYGLNLDVIIPIQKVLFLFATQQVVSGTVITQAFAPGALIDLTGVKSRDVKYDINHQWEPTSATWLTPIPTSADLTPILINGPSGLDTLPEVPGLLKRRRLL